jgi:hypothetical protein
MKPREDVNHHPVWVKVDASQTFPASQFPPTFLTFIFPGEVPGPALAEIS